MHKEIRKYISDCFCSQNLEPYSVMSDLNLSKSQLTAYVDFLDNSIPLV